MPLSRQIVSGIAEVPGFRRHPLQDMEELLSGRAPTFGMRKRHSATVQQRRTRKRNALTTKHVRRSLLFRRSFMVS